MLGLPEAEAAMAYRVIQWAAGGVGRAAIQGIANHPELELVGCFVTDPKKVGRDAKKRTIHEMAVATAPIDSPIGPIAPSRVAAQRFTWQGLVRGEPVVTARVNWLMGEANLDPAWGYGPEGERFEVEITGDPGVKVTFHGLHPVSIAQGLERNPGIVATALHCVNTIPYVCRAEPGIKTYLDLPLVEGRAAPHLLKGER
jgi:hypothetical protein